MIKTSIHTMKYANFHKKELLKQFISEYESAVAWYVTDLWDNKFIVNNQTLNIRNNELTTIKFYPSLKKPKTGIYARALKCAATQALGLVNSAIKKRQKQLVKLKELQKAGKNTANLQRTISNFPLIKPSVTNLPIELNSICANYIPTDNHFNGFLQLSSLGKKYGKILVPIKLTKHSNKLAKKGEMMKSFLISNDNVNFRWKITEPTLKTTGSTVGADQGILTCLTLSDGQTTKQCNHGHDLGSIQRKLANKTKGSKKFARAQAHRKNYTNWSINQLNLEEIKEIRYEKLYQVGKGQKKSRFLSHFAYRNIKDKVLDLCKQHGVRVVEQSSTYRSQRCSDCGYVHKSNRKGKQFKCKNCGMTKDADLNAALNHEHSLVICPFGFRSQENMKGFFWSLEEELTVPDLN